MNEYIDFVLVTHSDIIPPASIFNFIPLGLLFLFNILLEIIDKTIIGIKQNKIKVILYSYKQPKINPTIKTEMLIKKAPKIVNNNEFNLNQKMTYEIANIF